MCPAGPDSDPDEPGAAAPSAAAHARDPDPGTGSNGDAALATRLAAGAGRRLLELRDGWSAPSPPGGGQALGSAGDRVAQEYLSAELARTRPGDAVLSEEAPDDPARLQAERVWIVDPLDGTREFGEPGRVDWAVHVALWVRDGTVGRLAAGAVALPAQGVVLDTATVRPPAAPADRPLRVVVSRTRPPAQTAAVAAALRADVVPLGSAGAKAAEVVLGRAEVYLHAGGQHEWDSAAPVAVAQAAGLTACRLDGSPLAYNRPSPYLPDLLVCRPEVAAGVLAVLAGRG